LHRSNRSLHEKRRGRRVDVATRGVLLVAEDGGYRGLRTYTLEMPYQAKQAAVMALTFYLADEVRGDGVAVNAIMPGHTRASWFDATARAWKERGQLYAYRPVIPEHVVPIVLFLAAQDGRSLTGMLYPVPDWHYDHG